MVTRDGLFGRAALAVVTAVLAASAGQAALAGSSTDLEVGMPAATVEDTLSADEASRLERDLAQAQATVEELRVQVDDLSSRNVELEADNSTLQEAVEVLGRERDRLVASLAHFEALYEPLEADRQLLVELRKGLPETRPEAEAQLERIGRLALRSDPARLGKLVDRVREAAPAFLEWRFTEFDTTQEATAAYISGGANAFESTMEELRDAVLLSVHNRLDGLLNVLDRVR